MKLQQKWSLSICLALLVLAGLSALTLPKARADANLLPNGSVQYVYVKDEEGLRDYIDDNVAYSSQDKDVPPGYGNTYKIILDEPGTLLLYALSPSNGADIEVYSNFQLTSQLMKKRASENNEAAPRSLRVEPGTYYYRLSTSYSSVSEFTVYAGFIPDRLESISEKASAALKTDDNYPEVSYAIVKGADDLAQGIHDNMAYASLNRIEAEKSLYSETYKIVVDRPGLLIMAPLSSDNYAYVRLFSNASLTSKLLDSKVITGSHDGFYAIPVKPGNYYYYAGTPDYARQSGEVSMYIGFVPGYGEHGFLEKDVETSYAKAKASDHELATVTLSLLSDSDDFDLFVSAGKPNLTGTTPPGSGRTGRPYAIELKESGQFILRSSGSLGARFALFNNPDYSSVVLRYSTKEDLAKADTARLYLDKGSYYLWPYNEYFASSVDYAAFIGFVPSSSALSVQSIALNADKTRAEVQFNIHEAYSPDQSKGLVRVVPGVVADRSVDSQAIWKEKSNENAIESHTFIAEENGLYTARVAGTGLQSYMVTFEVTGIGGVGEPPALTAAPQAGDAPEEPVAPAVTEAPTPTPRPQLSLEEALLHIGMLEDILTTNQIEFQPEPVRSKAEIDAYIIKLEEILKDKGISF